MKRPVLSLYVRLFLWFVAANMVTLFGSVFLTQHLSRMAYVVDPDWTALAQGANEAYRRNGIDGLDHWSDNRRREGIYATLFEGERNLLPRPAPPPAQRELAKLLSEDSVVLRPRPEMLVAGQSVTGDDGIERHLIAVRGSRPPPPRIEQLLVVQLAASLLIIGALGWFAARSVSGPVAALQAATRRMGAGELSSRVGDRWTRRQDELGNLAADFDRMAARIEALVQHERGVLQDVSHELRSPLARLHLLLDLARRTPPDEAGPHFARAEREIVRLDRIIGEALALARMEGELPGMQSEAVELGELVRERIAESRIEADARGISVNLSGTTGLIVHGNASLIERAFDNLLSNAIKFSPEQSRIDIILRRDDSQAEIVVRDHGPGVPPEELGSLFRPFFRGTNASKAEGHGLGLTIVRRIAMAHGGSVEAMNAEPDGLWVTLRLPADATG